MNISANLDRGRVARGVTDTNIWGVKTQEGCKNDELIRGAKSLVENKMCVGGTHVVTFHRNMEINY